MILNIQEKKNDQNYKENNENKYLDIPLKQFIIAGFFPSIISVLNIIMCNFLYCLQKKNDTHLQ